VRVDRASAGEVAELAIDVTDNNGCLADFSVLGTDGEGGVAAPAYDDEGNLIPPLPEEGALPRHWWGEYVAKPAYWTNMHMLRFPLRLVDAAKGKFSLKITRRDIVPGIYVAEASIYSPGRTLRIRERRWLEIAPTLRYINNGPLTEQEVRLAMRDFACFNTFLQKEESEPEEVMFAIRRPVDLWNSTPPLGVAVHTVSTFPYREPWLQAAVGYLLRAHGVHRMRNELTVNSSTIQMKDNDKYSDYFSMGQRLLEEYLQFVRETKRAVNVTLGFGSLGSRYGLLAHGKYY
jgi:hypothetical protein